MEKKSLKKQNKDKIILNNMMVISMELFYITNASFSYHIARRFRNSSENGYGDFISFLIKRDVAYEDYSAIFNTNELNQLMTSLVALTYCKKNIFNELSATFLPALQDREYVFSPTPPAYHSDRDCPYLQKEYKNIEIPPEIKNRGEKATEEFLEYAEKNRFLFIEDPQKFMALASTRFLLVETFKLVSYENSLVFQSMPLQEMVNETLRQINEHEELKKMKYASIKIGTKHENEVVSKWFIQYKNPLYKKTEEELIKDKFSEFSFNASFLQDLGFKACGSCCK